MGLDYYAILDIPRSFNIHEIKSSYRKLALRLHPERKRFPKHPNPRPEGTFDLPLPSLPEDVYWEVLNEAYDVLSEPLHREVYNQYGEEGLKQGVSAPDGYIAPYRYHGDAMRTYFEFFSSYSPFSDLIDAITCPPPLYCVAEGVGVKNKDPTIEHLLQLELEEVFRGGVKFMKISRHEFVDEFEKKTEMKEVTLSVPITPGITEETRLVFPEAGDRGPTRIPADVAFTVCDQPHEFFRRDKSNLHMDHEITLKESLTGFKMKISTIDDRKLEFLITDVVDCNYTKCIPSEGLPIPNNDQLKGNLIVNLKIIFPSYIPKPLRLKLADLFDEIDKTSEEKNSCAPTFTDKCSAGNQKPQTDRSEAVKYDL